MRMSLKKYLPLTLVFLGLGISATFYSPDAQAFKGRKCKHFLSRSGMSDLFTIKLYRWFSFSIGLTTSTFQVVSSSGDCSLFGQMYIKKRMFIAQNMDVIKEEAGLGNGESLETLAHLSGCPNGDFPQFSAIMKKNYLNIFNLNENHQVSPDKIIQNIDKAIGVNSPLRKSCPYTEALII